MLAGLATAILLVAASALPAAAQAPSRAADAVVATNAAAAPPVIACASLANLRTVLRGVNDDSAAAVPVITDPRSDLGCNVLDKKTVTGVADHVALNGRSYECLSLQNTSVCRWTVAGSAAPAASNAGPSRTPPASPPQGKSKR